MAWQDYLRDTIIPNAPDELSAAQGSVAGITETRDDLISTRDAYQGIQGVCSLDLISRVVAKASEYTPGLLQPVWESSTYAEGAAVNPTSPNGLAYEATIGGISAIIEPQWPLTPGLTVVDGAVTWTCMTPVIAPAYGVAFGVTDLTSWSLSDTPGNFPVYSPTVDWDQDTHIQKDMNDWATMYSLLSTQYIGVLAMIANLASGISMMETQRDLIAARNAVLGDYV